MIKMTRYVRETNRVDEATHLKTMDEMIAVLKRQHEITSVDVSNAGKVLVRTKGCNFTLEIVPDA